MSILQEVQNQSKKKVPLIRTGHTVRVHQRIKEGEKDRIQIFEGLVIKMNSGFGTDKTFTVRKVVDGIGVEKIFPIFSPTIEKIEVTKKSKIRRAKLFYMRDRSGKSARLKATFIGSSEEPQAVEEAIEEAVEDATVAEETPATEEAVAEETTATEEAPTEDTATETSEAPAEAETPAAEEASATEEAPAEAEEKKE